MNTDRHFEIVVSCEDFDAPAEVVWNALMFYEEVTPSPPFFLRCFVPMPLESDGCKSFVGSEVECRYVGGHLRKRVIAMTEARHYAFEIVEQNLALGRIALLGGEYRFSELSLERTRVALSTRYVSRNLPRWFCSRFEALVCHSFHRHILSGMQNHLSLRPSLKRK